MIANDSVKDGKFGIVPLSSNRRHVSVDANALINKLLDAMRDRLFATNAAGTVRTNDAYQNLLDQVCVLHATFGHKIVISTMVKKRYGHCAIALASQEVLQCLHSKTMLTVKGDEFLMIFSPY